MPPTSASRRSATRPVAAICGPPRGRALRRAPSDRTRRPRRCGRRCRERCRWLRGGWIPARSRSRPLRCRRSAAPFGQANPGGRENRAAKEIFERLGAALWVERAETELRRASPRPRRDRELTSAERRVAALVASGLKNREVASQLFTTEATVEKHLTSVYRKLGIRSRTELARRVADGSLSLDDE